MRQAENTGSPPSGTRRRCVRCGQIQTIEPRTTASAHQTTWRSTGAGALNRARDVSSSARGMAGNGGLRRSISRRSTNNAAIAANGLSAEAVVMRRLPRSSRVPPPSAMTSPALPNATIAASRTVAHTRGDGDCHLFLRRPEKVATIQTPRHYTQAPYAGASPSQVRRSALRVARPGFPSAEWVRRAARGSA